MGIGHLKVLAPPPTIYLANEPSIWGCSHGEVCSTLQLKGSQSSTDFGDVVRADRRDGIGGDLKECFRCSTDPMKWKKSVVARMANAGPRLNCGVHRVHGSHRQTIPKAMATHREEQ